MKNKGYKFEFQITNIEEHEKHWLSDEIKSIIVVGNDFKECLQRAKKTIQKGWGNRDIIFNNNGIEVEIKEQIKSIDFSYLNKMHGADYYEVFNKNEKIYGTSDLREAVRKMNNIGNTAWIYDKNDEPYNASFVYGYEL